MREAWLLFLSKKAILQAPMYKRFMDNKYDVAAELTKKFKSFFPKYELND